MALQSHQITKIHNTREQRNNGSTSQPGNNEHSVSGKFWLSTMTLDINSPSKGHRVAEWITKQIPSICCLQEIHFAFFLVLGIKLNFTYF